MEQILKQKSIVLVPVPFFDYTGTKRRPALVLSNDGFNKNSQDFIICAITSNISAENSVFINAEDWKEGDYSESCIKLSGIYALDKKLIIKKIGRLSTERFRDVLFGINKIFGE